jgi:hypothetical protein|nr:MAG TPA: hypothetical protein [Caudoviricetes sp.]
MKQTEIQAKYFTRWHYDFIETTSSKSEYIARVGKLANVANKRAKTLTTAISKGRITEDRTALFRYQDAVDYFNKHVAYNASYVSTGKAVYKDFSIRELRALENKLLHYLEAKASTARGSIEVENKRVATFKERYGVDISSLSKNTRDKLFNTLQYLSDKNYAQLSSDQIVTMLTEALNTNTRDGLQELFKASEELYPNLKEQAEFRVAIIQNSSLSWKDKAREFKAANKLYKSNRAKPKPRTIRQEL